MAYYGNYLDADKFLEEYKKSVTQDRQTDEFVKMFMKLADHALYNRFYNDPMDRDDCFSGALYDFARYWKGFKLGHNKNESNSCFCYFTSMARNGALRQWNMLKRENRLGTRTSIDSLYESM